MEDPEENVKPSISEGGKTIQEPGNDCIPSSHSYNVLEPPKLPVPLTGESEILYDTIIDLFTTTRVCDIIPENTKIVVVDSRMPLHIAIRSLFEYSKPLVVVYSEVKHKVTGCFDILELIDYFLYLNMYFNNPTLSTFLESPSDPPHSTSNPSSTLMDGLGASQSIRSEPIQNKVETDQCATTSDATAPESIHTYTSHISLGSIGHPAEPAFSAPSAPSFSTTGDANYPNHPLPGPVSNSSVLPPWAFSLDKWKETNQLVRPCEYVSGNQTTFDALKILLEKSIPYVIVWNDERSAPLSFLTPMNILGHLLQSLRGNFLHFDLALRSQLNVGTFGNIKTLLETTTIIEALQVLRETDVSAIPIVDPNGGYVGCFSENHFLQLIFKSFAEDFSIHPDMPIIKVFKMFHSNSSAVQCSASSNVASNALSHTTQTSKRPNSESPIGPQGYCGFQMLQKTTSAIVVNDITLRDAILHILLSDERRIFFIEGERRIVTGVVTITDLCKYLVDFDATTNILTTRKQPSDGTKTPKAAP